MAVWLWVAAVATVAIGVAHSWLGERYLLQRLFRRSDLPKLLGSTEFTIRTLRFAWHITTLAWWGFAAQLVLLARDRATPAAVAGTVAVTFLVSFLVSLLASRGRHLSWLVFLLIGLVAGWFALGAAGGR
jgi:hypothetical protein